MIMKSSGEEWVILLPLRGCLSYVSLGQIQLAFIARVV